MAAFRRAIQLGAGFIETDLHLTRDAKFVAIHDATLERTTNGQGSIHDATLAEIARNGPGSIEDLRGIPGMGARKLDRFGWELLEVVSAD